MSAVAAGGPAAPPSVAFDGTNKWFIASAVALGALLEIIDTSIVNVALTDMQASLGATLEQVSWVVSSYGIANVIILPLAAWLGHRFGKKRYFVFSLVGFTAASVVCGLSGNLLTLVVARVLQGLTGGGLLAKAQSVLFETFPREEQAMAQAFFGSIVIAGPAIGPTLGGYLVTNVGWRWIFFINLPLGVLAVAMVLAALPADPPAPAEHAPVDWVALVLLATGLGSLQTFLEEGNAHDWFDEPWLRVLAVAAVVGIVLFVVRELGSDRPVVDLRVLRHRSLWAGSIVSVVVGMALYGTLFAVPVFAQSVLHFTSQQTGMLLLPGALASAVAMPIAGKVISRFDPRIMLVCGACILVVALALFAGLNAGTSGDDLFWPLIVRSFGTVFMFLPLQLATLGPLPKSEVAAATGFFSLTRQLGGSIGVALLTVLLSHRLAFHRGVLVEKLVATDPRVLDRLHALTAAMAARGADSVDAVRRAYAMLDAAVMTQASILSFADTFWATGAVVLSSLPLVLLLGRPAPAAKVELGH